MNERRLGDYRAISSLSGSKTVVIIVKETDTKSLVEETDFVDHLSSNEETKSDQSRKVPHAVMVILPPVPREPIEHGDIVVACRYLLRATDVVGTGPNDANCRITVQSVEKNDGAIR